MVKLQGAIPAIGEVGVFGGGGAGTKNGTNLWRLYKMSFTAYCENTASELTT